MCIRDRWNDDGDDVSDGGRLKRFKDTFTLDFTGSTAPVIVARLAAAEPIRLTLKLDGKAVSGIELPATGWAEVEVKAPEGTTGKHVVDVEGPGDKPFGSMHYWVFAE